MLDTAPLKNAIHNLDDILKQPINEYIRDGVIQRFEYTFEICWKFMQRLLKERGVEAGSPNQVLRAAHKEHLIEDIDMWLVFLKNRNLTVHTYNKDTAEEVFAAAKQFLPFAIKTLKIINENVKST
jgi:nucleotidyltransferase substrate binding protein (TIGR01987 family)